MSFKRDFIIDEGKPSYAEWIVAIDLSSWLDSETISSVTFSAKDTSGNSATSVVLDSTKSTFTTTIIKPFVKGGVNGTTYIVIMKVTTNAGSKDEFSLKFTVKDM